MKKRITLLLDEDESNEFLKFMGDCLIDGSADLNNLSDSLKKLIFEYSRTSSKSENDSYPTKIEIEERKIRIESIRYRVNQKIHVELSEQEFLGLADYISEKMLNEFVSVKSTNIPKCIVSGIIKKWFQSGRRIFLPGRKFKNMCELRKRFPKKNNLNKKDLPF